MTSDVIHVDSQQLEERRKAAVDRSYFVAKKNIVIQKCRSSFSASQLKALAYCISRIKPTDLGDEEYVISIRDYQRAAGMNSSGKNYEDLKENLKRLADASFWIRTDEKKETLFRWFSTLDIVSEGEGSIRFKFHERCVQFLYELRSNYTQYGLDMILPLRSKYSIRLYELLISYHDVARRDFPTQLHINLTDLKVLMNAEVYDSFVNFRHRALDVAIEEIGMYTDIYATYTMVKGGKSGREVVAIEFCIYTQDLKGAAINSLNRQRRLRPGR